MPRLRALRTGIFDSTLPRVQAKRKAVLKILDSVGSYGVKLSSGLSGSSTTEGAAIAAAKTLGTHRTEIQIRGGQFECRPHLPSNPPQCIVLVP